jgi:hypothetical protein
MNMGAQGGLAIFKLTGQNLLNIKEFCERRFNRN